VVVGVNELQFTGRHIPSEKIKPTTAIQPLSVSGKYQVTRVGRDTAFPQQCTISGIPELHRSVGIRRGQQRCIVSA